MTRKKIKVKLEPWDARNLQAFVGQTIKSITVSPYDGCIEIKFVKDSRTFNVHSSNWTLY